MKILSTFVVKTRGPLAFVALDCEPPAIGKDEMVRSSDGARWLVAGIEFFLHRPPRKNDRVGLLLRGDATFKEGDEIELARHSLTAVV